MPKLLTRSDDPRDRAARVLCLDEGQLAQIMAAADLAPHHNEFLRSVSNLLTGFYSPSNNDVINAIQHVLDCYGVSTGRDTFCDDVSKHMPHGQSRRRH